MNTNNDKQINRNPNIPHEKTMNPSYEHDTLIESMSAEPQAGIRDSQISKELKRIEELDQCLVDHIGSLREALCFYLLPDTPYETEPPFDKALALENQSALQVELEKIIHRRKNICVELEYLISRVNP